MRLILLSVLFFVFLKPAFADESERYWVFFKDKGQIFDAEISYKTAAVLSQKALERRSLRSSSALLTYSDLPPSGHYIRQLENLGIKIHHQSHWLNAVSCYLNGADRKQIASLSFVQRISPVKTYIRAVGGNGLFPPDLHKPDNEEYGPSLNQNAMLGIPASHAAGLHGENILIAVFDTGFILDHEVFNQIQVTDTWDFIHNDPDVDNDENDLPGQHNHGSEVLAVLAGYKPGELIGPAYRARFLLAKTEDLSSETHLEEDNWVAAAEWAERAGADIISTSVGYDYSVGYTYDDMDGNTAIITRAADLAVKKGVAVFSAAGNEGLGAWKYIGAPADGDSVIAVGGVRPDGTYWPSSSQGPTYDGRLKPDLAAQAQQVYSINSSSIDEYQYVNGTSFACPLVAGTAAIVLSAMPFLDPVALRDTLKQYASRNDNPDNFVGSGLVDMERLIVFFLNKPGVHLLEFTGSAGPGRNLLAWSVDREIGNTKWLIRRCEGNAPVQKISEIESIPSLTGIQNYSYTDANISSGRSFTYKLFAVLQTGEELFVDSLTLSSIAPAGLSLLHNYPNPFNDRTRIIIGLSNPQTVNLAVFNIRGQLIKELIADENLSADFHHVIWDATDSSGKKVSTGNYFVRLKSDSGERMMKILYVK
jgi:hypothetical protein